MKIKVYLLLLLVTAFFPSFGQAPSIGDYQTVSNKTSGNWSDISIWETYNGNTWVSAGVAPDYSNGKITINNGFTVTLDSEVYCDELVISRNGHLTVAQNITMNIIPGNGDDLIINGTLTNEGSIILFSLINEATGEPEDPNVIINGILINSTNGAISASAPSLFSFNSGSTYVHNVTATTGSIPDATWDVSSTCRIKGIFGQTPPNNVAQEFGNFIWETTSVTSPLGSRPVDFNGIFPTSIKGDLIFQQTDRSTVFLSNSTSTTPITLSVRGNLIISQEARVTFTNNGTFTANIDGNFEFSGQSVRNSLYANATFHVGGNINLLSGTYKFNANSGSSTYNFGGHLNFGATSLSNTNNSSSSITFVGNGSSASGITQTLLSNINTSLPINFIIGSNNTPTSFSLNGYSITTAGSITVTDGSMLDLGSGFFSGTDGSFNLNTNCTVSLANSKGITNLLTEGAIRITTKNFSTGSTIIYNGTTEQNIGDGFPFGQAVNLEIKNTSTGGVTMPSISTVSFAGDLALTQGSLNLAPNTTVSILGNFSRTNGGFGGNESASVILSGSGSLITAPLFFTSGKESLHTLTVDRTSDIPISLASSLSLENLNLNSVDLLFENQSLQISGTLSGTKKIIPNSNSSLTILGSNNFGIIPFGGVSPSIGNLTLDRINGSYRINTNILVTDTLHLKQGSLVNVTGLTLATGSTFFLEGNSTLANARPVAQGAYNIYYKNLPSNHTIGLEFPEEGSAIGSLYVEGGTFTAPFNLLLNGGLTISNNSSTVNTGGYDINLKGDFINHGTFVAGNSKVEFSGSEKQVIGGSSNTTFNNMLVSNTSAQGVINKGNNSLRGILNFASATNIFDADGEGSEDFVFTLLSNAEGTASIGRLLNPAQFQGKITAQRFLSNPVNQRVWRYITVPVAGTNVADWKQEMPITGKFADPSQGPGINSAVPSLYYYDETKEGEWGNGWIPYPSSGTAAQSPLDPKKGYCLFIRSKGMITLDARGVPSKGTIEIPLTYTPSSAEIEDGFNLIGNPYPAAIDWDLITKSSNISPTIYVKDNMGISGNGAGNFAYYTTGGVGIPANFDGQIASGQAFYVQVVGTEEVQSRGSVTISENHKVNRSDATFFRKSIPTDYLRISLSGNGKKDEAVIIFKDNASANANYKEDAYKLQNDYLNLSTFSSDSANLAINVLPTLNCKTVVGINIGKVDDGNYSVTFSEFESFTDPHTTVLLIDQYTQDTINLRTTSSYKFTTNSAPASKSKNRFCLLFNNNTFNTALNVETYDICQNQSAVITINNSEPGISYSIEKNGITINNPLIGQGQNLNILVPKENLAPGKNIFRIKAEKAGCFSSYLETPVEIFSHQAKNVESVKEGKRCGAGTITLEAFGASGNEIYHWYESATATIPIEGQYGGTFITPPLAKSRSYFVSIVNAMGCESETRKEVRAVVHIPEDISINLLNNTLSITKVKGTIYWYKDRELISEATDYHYTPTTSGIYHAEVTTENCTIKSEDILFTISDPQNMADTNILLYPNPVQNDLHIQFPDNTKLKSIRILDLQGKLLLRKDAPFSDTEPVKLNVNLLTSGTYIIEFAGESFVMKKIFIKK